MGRLCGVWKNSIAGGCQFDKELVPGPPESCTNIISSFVGKAERASDRAQTCGGLPPIASLAVILPPSRPH